MKIKFKDGTIKNCTQPTEQKFFRNNAAAGWLLSFSITASGITSDSLDETITAENISLLTLLDDNEKELYSLSGYSELSSAIIKHSEAGSRADLQLKKNVGTGDTNEGV